MTDIEKDILDFRRKFEDERDERFRRSLARFEGDDEIESAVEVDLSGYVPKIREATGWALDNLPEEVWFASNSERIQLALESMEGLSIFSEIPEDYLEWARNADWSDPEIWTRSLIEKSEWDKFPNFLVILMPYFAAHFSDIPDTIEHVVAYRSPKDGDCWYAARVVQATAELFQCHHRVQDKVLSGEISDDYDLEEELSVATQAAFTIGWLHRDRWWMEQHSDAAAKYYEKAASLVKAQTKGSLRTREKFAQLKDDCLGFYQQAIDERGFAFVGAPIAVVAETIREIAMREKPSKFVGPKGQPLSVKWFQETLEDFQADGRHARALEEALTK